MPDKFYFKILVVFLLSFTLPSTCCEIDRMTLEEKVGQLFLTYFDGECVNEHATRLIRETKIGGIIYYNWANGLDEPDNVRKMSNDLQELANQYIGIPLFIAIDQEGGLVSRLQKGFTEFPGNAALGRTDQLELAYEASYFMGQELRAVGVNLNLAPVVDVNNNRENPIIGIRSFSEDKKAVTAFGKNSMKGFKDSGVISCLKHFPGHGDVAVDSHRSLPIVDKSFEEINEIELFPFRKLLADAPAMMTAHILFTQLDPKNCATLSSLILQDFLRKKLNFKGVLITDSLAMQGVVKGYANMERVVIKAFEAGNDILLIGGRDLHNQVDGKSNIDEIIRLYHCLLDAIRDGKISEDRLNASVSRILKLKKEAGLFGRQFSTDQNLNETLQRKEHLQLAREIAYRSVQIHEWNLKHDLSEKNVAIVSPKILEGKIRSTDLMCVGSSTRLYTFEGLEPSPEESQHILENIESSHYVIFCSYQAWKMLRQQQLLKKISTIVPSVCIAVRDPYDLDCCAHLEVKIAAYSPSSCSLQAAAEYLKGKTQPLSISFEQAQDIGKQIWFNECRNRVDQLTFWNENEPFPSIGIGHFVWPPKHYKGVFSRGRFHSVIEFFQGVNIKVPDWLVKEKFSPWSTREKFYQEFDSERMKELRFFLEDTIPYQAQYMVKRLNDAFREIVLSVPVNDRKGVINQFFRVGRRLQGPYILIDYLNFKHEGTDPKERYRGKGWGLMQVLQLMANEDEELQFFPEKNFATCARKVLLERVSNSQDSQKEEKWLPGWFNRLDTYSPIYSKEK